MRLYDTTIPDDEQRRYSLSMNAAELDQLRRLLQEASDCGLDRRGLSAALDAECDRDRGQGGAGVPANRPEDLPLVMTGQGDYIRCYGPPAPGRAQALTARAADLAAEAFAESAI